MFYIFNAYDVLLFFLFIVIFIKYCDKHMYKYRYYVIIKFFYAC